MHPLVLQLVALDESNPRAIAFQFVEIERLVQRLPGRHHSAVPDALGRNAWAGLSRVRLADARSLLEAGANNRQSLGKFLEVLERLPEETATLLNAHYFRHVDVTHRLDTPDVDYAAGSSS